ncbi:MAG: zinc-binding alcohol dehydrogenase family protein [Verrucomicrobia bacterium]|nr:zinc-binding alcohol dehydrogenase family protein [Verrucomicrobiota bacterium]MDA1006113.1 zinc-binding alcohol dehydrogenase family protein [Verrucomicrobiota bacterium]
MQAIEFTNPKEINIIDIPHAGAPGPGEAVVRTHRMGICGTDLSCYLGKFPFFAYPRTPGHELGLEVIAVGEGVTNVKPGDKCSLEPYVNDPSTIASQKGKSNACPNVQVIGVHKSGGLRKSNWIVPAHKLHPGNELSYDELALVETLAIGFHAVKRGNPQPGETVMVIGAGPIGLACLEFLKLMDLKVLVVDFARNRLDFCAEKLGIAHPIQAKPDGSHLAEIEKITEGGFCDVIIDATGHAGSMVQCFEYAAVGGRIVYVGITSQEITFPQAPFFHRRELSVLASRNALPADFPEIIDIIKAGKINLNNWITHRLDIADVPTEFDQFTDPATGAIKAVITVN